MMPLFEGRRANTMKLILVTILTVAFPVAVSAAGLVATSAGVEYHVASVSVTNGGSINSTTKSSASTGGNTVGEGGSVTTGTASASSRSEVKTDGGSGSVNVKVETETNGEKKSEEYRKEMKSGEAVNVKVEANSKSEGGKTESSVRVVANGEVLKAATTTTDANVAAENDGDDSGFTASLFESIATGIKKAFFSFVSVFSLW